MRTLPKRIHFNDGRYWHVKTAKGKQTWTPLTRDVQTSIVMGRRIDQVHDGDDFMALQRGLRRCWISARWRARKGGFEFSIGWEDVRAMAERQGWCCALTGLPLSMKVTNADRAGPYGPSLDRIVPKHGYATGNVRLVCVAVNMAMNEWGLEFLMGMSRALLVAKTGQNLGDEPFPLSDSLRKKSQVIEISGDKESPVLHGVQIKNQAKIGT